MYFQCLGIFMNTNRTINNAKKNKKDEFYTQYNDIAKELPYYKEQLANKVIYCNCDNHKYSNFYKFFKENFHEYKLKSVIATYLGFNKYYSYKPNKTVFDGENEIITDLLGSGDFRSIECVNILQKCDIVITNPPFSLFREFIKLLIEYDKKFIVLGALTAIGYLELFPFFMTNKIRLSEYLSNISFEIPNNSYKQQSNRYWISDNGKTYCSFGNICWYTNLENTKPLKKLNLIKHYNKNEYQVYDNCNAINVDKVANIPVDYNGIMGVPITFLAYYNPEQFEIIRLRKGNDGKELSINGKYCYNRILIKRRNNNK